MALICSKLYEEHLKPFRSKALLRLISLSINQSGVHGITLTNLDSVVLFHGIHFHREQVNYPLSCK